MIEALRAGDAIDEAVAQWGSGTLANTSAAQFGPLVTKSFNLRQPLVKDPIREGVWGLPKVCTTCTKAEVQGAHVWSRWVKTGPAPQLTTTFANKRDPSDETSHAHLFSEFKLADEALPDRAVTTTTSVPPAFHAPLRCVAKFLRLVLKHGSSADSATIEALIHVEPLGGGLVEVVSGPAPHTLAPWAGPLLQTMLDRVRAGGTRIHGSIDIFTGTWNFVLGL